MDCLRRHGVEEELVDTAWVPGGFEIPIAAKRFVATGRYAAVICVGCIIQGDTPHFHYVSSEVSKGIAHVSFESDIPVVYGVVTEYCVRCAAMGLLATGKPVELVLDGVRSLSDEDQQNTLAEFRASGGHTTLSTQL